MTVVERTTRLAAPAEAVWAAVNTPRLLLHVASPMLAFRPIAPPSFPEHWGEGEYLVALRGFGIVPLGRQVVNVSRPAPQKGTRFIRDNGYSKLVKRWDHWITIEPDQDQTLYTDRVEIEAGAFTPVVAGFARRFYAHRQSRLRALAEVGFDYAKAGSA